MEPRVTVVIPTLNRLAYLREAVASVWAQEGVGHELIVVDNASTDGTVDWLRALDDPAAPTRYVLGAPAGLNGASIGRNAGLERARGEYVWFLDDDDRLRPGALAVLAAALDRHPGAVGAVGARTRFGAGVPGGGRMAHPLRPMIRDARVDLLLGWGFIPSQTLCRTSALRAAGGWNVEVGRGQDHELWPRLALQGPLVLEPQIVAEYRVHEGQVTGRTDGRVARRVKHVFPRATELAGGDEARGRRLVEASILWSRARDAFDGGQYSSALRSTARGIVTAPELVRSPLLRPQTTRMLVRSTLRCTAPTRRWVERRAAAQPAGGRPRRGAGYLS
jgi:glycosyltransferase involved in cell wall biosynthesis